MRFHLAPLDRTGWAGISLHLVEREDGIVFKHAVADETYLPGARAPDTASVHKSCSVKTSVLAFKQSMNILFRPIDRMGRILLLFFVYLTRSQ